MLAQNVFLLITVCCSFIAAERTAQKTIPITYVTVSLAEALIGCRRVCRTIFAQLFVTKAAKMCIIQL